MKRGFTLIELLVVISILAILASAALPYVQSYVEEARIAKAKTDLEEIARALMVYETREGPYNSDSVSLLTGRYLNKAPIDPWGKTYAVSTESGTVVSGGPDRSVSSAEDNIYFSYLPPLTLVQVKWLDKNNSGAVDAQNVNDELHLVFSRKMSATGASDFFTGACQATLDKCFQISTGTVDNKSDISAVVEATAADVKIVASKTLILKVKNNSRDLFLIGSHKITVKAGHNTLQDLANPPNYCISSQPVTILPQ
ncbi:MAG TPA: prepilin-type N-terminal cleavage/methylation domain-containing protein [Candidatus Ozemobacteraceae bacterium]|nr:prepilin-type N-terminal cleavage/methylation domain-containing protein [Candidatus Ozemobacteraceae bacterium]HQG27976.1 prepilin-type N-terminal cleavage/methylation domain-containing protein [Candidatus Ozemobacteraceae bacterium]